MSKTTRRSFAAAIAALPLVRTDLLAQASQPSETKPSPLSEAFAEIVRAEYGRFVSDDEMERIGKEFQDYIPPLQRLRDVKLVNSDEPDFTFAPLAKRW